MSSPVITRRGGPLMVAGGPSLNPKGRPRIGLSLAEAMRAKFPVDKIVELATELATKSADERVRMVALQFIADRGYGKVLDKPFGDAPDAGAGRVDWSAVPLERRRALVAALTEVDQMAVPIAEEVATAPVEGDSDAGD